MLVVIVLDLLDLRVAPASLTRACSVLRLAVDLSAAKRFWKSFCRTHPCTIHLSLVDSARATNIDMPEVEERSNELRAVRGEVEAMLGVKHRVDFAAERSYWVGSGQGSNDS